MNADQQAILDAKEAFAEKLIEYESALEVYTQLLQTHADKRIEMLDELDAKHDIVQDKIDAMEEAKKEMLRLLSDADD